MSKPLRTLSTFSRQSFRTRPCKRGFASSRPRRSILRQYGEVNVQPVRFKQDPKRGPSLFLLKTTLVVATGYFILEYLDLDLEEEDKAALARKKLEAGNTEGEGDGEDEAEAGGVVQIPDEMPEDALFIPVGLTRQRPQEYYMGTDPEWQSFIDFRKDPGREKAVRRDLANLVGQNMAGFKPMQRGLGTPLKVQKYWFDVVIPEGPPREYERSGIEIADEYVAWTTRPVSALQMARLQSTLFPWPMAKAFWASYNTFWSLQLARVKQYLNLDSGSANSSPVIPTGMISLDQIKQKSDQIKQNGAKQEPQTRTQMNKMSDPKATEESSTKTPPSKPSATDSSRVLSSLPAFPKVGGDMDSAIMEFKRTLAKNWQPPTDFGERGTILVSGLVRLEGPKGFCVIDVMAAYHPQDARYTHVKAGVRHFIPKRQGPRRQPPKS